MERDSHGRHSLHHQSVREILQAAARAGPSANVAGPCKTAAGSTERGTQPGARSRTIGGGVRPHSVFHPGNGGVTQSNQSSENPGRFSSAGASGSDWGSHQIRVEMHVWRETSTTRYRAQSSPPLAWANGLSTPCGPYNGRAPVRGDPVLSSRLLLRGEIDRAWHGTGDIRSGDSSGDGASERGESGPRRLSQPRGRLVVPSPYAWASAATHSESSWRGWFTTCPDGRADGATVWR